VIFPDLREINPADISEETIHILSKPFSPHWALTDDEAKPHPPVSFSSRFQILRWRHPEFRGKFLQIVTRAVTDRAHSPGMKTEIRFAHSCPSPTLVFPQFQSHTRKEAYFTIFDTIK
jgi:hypothetical protein